MDEWMSEGDFGSFGREGRKQGTKGVSVSAFSHARMAHAILKAGLRLRGLVYFCDTATLAHRNPPRKW